MPEHDKAIKSFALKAWRRAQAGGARSLQLEDVQQELVVAWCMARDNWKPEFNVPFLAYLRRGMKQTVNRWLQSQIDFGHAMSMDDDDDEERAPHEIIADASGLAGVEVFERDNARDAVVKELSAEAQVFVNLLREPPAELLEGVRARRARQTFAREQGLIVPGETDRVTASMVLDLMELSHAERGRLYAELDQVKERQRRAEDMDLRFAPGCFGSPHCYKNDHALCSRCVYASKCAPEALARKLTLQARFGIKPKVEPPRPKPAVDPKLLLIRKALRAGKNPFNRSAPKQQSWWVIADILLRKPAKACFKAMVLVLAKLVGDVKRSAEHVNKMLADLLRTGAVVKQGDLYVIR